LTYFHEWLSKETWENIYLNNDFNSIFSDSLKTYILRIVIYTPMHSAQSHLMVEFKNTTIEKAASTKYLDQILLKLSADGFVIRKVFLALHFITL
jgi:hypothetical protein